MKIRLLILAFCWHPVWVAAAPQPATPGIAASHPLATAAGFEILAAGGNAFDAAVAVSAALCVVEPYSSGLGGGGFWLLRTSDGSETFIDGREVAPQAAKADMYLDEKGAVVKGLSLDGALAAGIPGLPAGLAYMAERYGRLPLAASLAPAIRYAEEGFPVYRRFLLGLTFKKKAMAESAAAQQLFFVDGEPPAMGSLFRQPELAGVLRALAKQGSDGFYRGPIAERLVDGVAGRRRHMDSQGSRGLPRQRTGAVDWQLPRHEGGYRAAAIGWRCRPTQYAEYLVGIRFESGRRRYAQASHRRSAAPRLSGSRRFLGRSRFRRCPC